MKIPAMKTPALATVYLDDASVGLMGDPRPRVSKIVAAGGKQPGTVQVVRTRSAREKKGEELGMEDVIDRTLEPTRPIYLRSRPNAVPVDVPAKSRPSSSASIESPSSDAAGRRALGDPRPGVDVLRGGRRA